MHTTPTETIKEDTTGSANSGHDYYEDYAMSGQRLDNNSVGPELTQRASHQTRTPSTDLSVADNAPEVDHYHEPTKAAHKPT
jgi:hypothetical protein